MYLQVKNQSNNREEKDQKRPAKLTSDVTIRVHDFKDDNQIENQDDEANETTTVLEHIINHFVLFVYQKKKKESRYKRARMCVLVFILNGKVFHHDVIRQLCVCVCVYHVVYIWNILPEKLKSW